MIAIRNLILGLIILAAIWFSASGESNAQQANPFQVGDRVVAIRDVALRVPEGETATVAPGFVLTVSAIDGDWLWVNAGRPGWIHRANLIALSEAGNFFDQLVRRNRGDRRWVYARALVAHELGNTAAAIEDLSQLVRRHPQDASYLLARGFAYFDQGDVDAAVNDFSAVLAFDAENVKALNNRANVYVNLGRYDEAVTDLNEAIRLDQENAAAFNNRGHAYEMQGDYEKALADFKQATDLDPKYALAANNLAWLAATCPDDGIRQGKLAVAWALAACELANHEQPLYASTLAAAYAEQGDFEKAVEMQAKANELAGDQLPEEFESRLQLFQQGKPYRMLSTLNE